MMTPKGRELICEDIASRNGERIMADIDRLCGDAHCVSFALLISPAGEKTHLVSNMCRSCLETNFGSLLADVRDGSLRVPEGETVGHA